MRQMVHIEVSCQECGWCSCIKGDGLLVLGCSDLEDIPPDQPVMKIMTY